MLPEDAWGVSILSPVYKTQLDKPWATWFEFGVDPTWGKRLDRVATELPSNWDDRTAAILNCCKKHWVSKFPFQNFIGPTSFTLLLLFCLSSFLN